jgi:YfiH family protein
MVMSEPGRSAVGDEPGTLPEPNDAFVWRQVPWGWALECAALAPHARHLFTTRDLAPGRGAELDAAWTRVAAFIELPAESVWRMDQVHGCRTIVIGEASQAPRTLPTADGIASNRADVGLVVKVADCVPVLLADPKSGAVAAIHAGWRGTAQGIAIAAVETLARSFGSAASDLIAAVGPSIGPCCYEVGPEVRAGFESAVRGAATETFAAHWFSRGEGDRLQLDLWAANRDQLAIAGVPSASIHVARLCTACHLDRFFSFRREGANAGRLLAAIRRRSEEAAV